MDEAIRRALEAAGFTAIVPWENGGETYARNEDSVTWWTDGRAEITIQTTVDAIPLLLTALNPAPEESPTPVELALAALGFVWDYNYDGDMMATRTVGGVLESLSHRRGQWHYERETTPTPVLTKEERKTIEQAIQQAKFGIAEAIDDSGREAWQRHHDTLRNLLTRTTEAKGTAPAPTFTEEQARDCVYKLDYWSKAILEWADAGMSMPPPSLRTLAFKMIQTADRLRKQTEEPPNGDS